MLEYGALTGKGYKSVRQSSGYPLLDLWFFENAWQIDWNFHGTQVSNKNTLYQN